MRHRLIAIVVVATVVAMPHHQAYNSQVDMLRRTKTVLGAVLCVVVISVAAAAVTYIRAYSDRGPASEEEFRVYGVFLTSWAADRHLGPNEVVLARTTLQLSAPPESSSWSPPELRSDKIQPPPDFVSFCGGVCGHDFVRKNLSRWQLKPIAQGQFGISIEDVPKTPQTPKKYVVAVTRIGFNLWHTRAVLSYTADCNDFNDYSTAEMPIPYKDWQILCVEYGEAYLQKRDGIWKMDHYHRHPNYIED